MTIITTRKDANGRAEAIAMDLERAALGADTMFHVARAFGSLDLSAYSGPISYQMVNRIQQALDRVRPIILTFASNPDEVIYILAAVESARMRTGYWSHTQAPGLLDCTGSTSADLVRWLSKSCATGCRNLKIGLPPRLQETKLPDSNVQATPRKARK